MISGHPQALPSEDCGHTVDGINSATLGKNKRPGTKGTLDKMDQNCPDLEILFGHNGNEKHRSRHNTTTNLHNFSARIFLDRPRKLILMKFGRPGRKCDKYHAKRPPELLGEVGKSLKIFENDPYATSRAENPSK